MSIYLSINIVSNMHLNDIANDIYLCASDMSGSFTSTDEFMRDKFFPPLNSPTRAPLTARIGLLEPSKSSACFAHNVTHI